VARKRAPGGGRKPKHGVRASPLSLRVPKEVREGLEASAAERKQGKGWSLSEEILLRLKQTFYDERRDRDRASKALCRFLTEVILAVANSTVGPNWRSDPWAFKAIRLAFDRVLVGLEPPGEIRAPATRQGVWAAGANPVRFQLGEGTPEEMAHFISDVILMRPTFEEPFAVSRFEAEEDSSGNVFEYTMARAFRDLKLKETNQ
jgi:hypothetical protein